MAIAMKMAAQRQGAGVQPSYNFVDRNDEEEDAIDDISDRIDLITEKMSQSVAVSSTSAPEGRKQEKEIIDGYNMQLAVKWRKTIQNAIDEIMPLLSEIVEVDADLENTFADKSDAMYTMLKKRFVFAYTPLLPIVSNAITTVFDCPLIEFVYFSRAVQ